MRHPCLVRPVVVALCAACLAACSGGDARAEPGPQTRPAELATVGCEKGDLLACEFPPFEDLKQACAYLQKHVAGRQVGDRKVQEVDDCEAPVQAPASEFGAAAVAADVTVVKGPPSHGAFLFVRLDREWRLTDYLLVPAWTHGGSCDTRFQLRWQGREGSYAAVLDSLSERICRMPLDAKERAAGVSDVASTECRHTRHGLAGRKLTRLSSEESAKVCPIAKREG